MRTLAFDTLEFAKKLKAANFTEEQAEALVEARAGIVEERLATKQDLKELETKLEARLREMELRLRRDLTLRLGGMPAAAVAIVAALVKLLEARFFIVPALVRDATFLTSTPPVLQAGTGTSATTVRPSLKKSITCRIPNHLTWFVNIFCKGFRPAAGVPPV